MRASTLVFTLFTLAAFAANSVLCRLALRPDLIDAVSFTVLRIGAGAIVLLPIVARGLRAQPRAARPPMRAAFALFAYAIAFSLAYRDLATGTGALLLFGTVQVTMIAAALVAGERPRPLEWLGGGVALAGLVWLVLPGISAPPLTAAALMMVSGIAWGGYSLLGRVPSSSGRTPAHDTAWSFVRATPLALVALLVAFADAQLHATAGGVALALISGAFTSGLGYVLWYVALRGHTATSAAFVQLAVPIVAALGGVVVLDESVTLRLIIAIVLVLGGVAVAVLARRPAAVATGVSRVSPVRKHEQ